MSFADCMAGRKGLVLGVANDRSIAWGITQVLHQVGARLGFSYQGERLEKRVRPLVEQVDGEFFLPCDVGDDAQIDALFKEVDEKWGGLDFLVHSIGFADKKDLEGNYIDTSREGWLKAHDISSWSFTRLAREAASRMKDGSSMITLSYLGAERAVKGYNVMGVAKASLEASMRYLAADLGERGIRVNAISAGPIQTLAARGIRGFSEIFGEVEKKAALGRGVTTEEVGNTATFLLSPLASGITGEVIYVDGGFRMMG
ncbi:MAG: enoyl-ACP reductase [Planctomycetota bacterium]|nr:enoyl-ACP reductase [Planctomycetota bacterium]